MVGLLSYGLILIAIQNYNQKKRTDLPQTITVLLAAVAPVTSGPPKNSTAGATAVRFALGLR